MGIVNRLRGQDGERGTTMIELVVTMGLMSIFMAIFTTAILAITKTAAKVEAVAASSAQSNYAFLRLDKSIRYANAITTPSWDGTASMWHVEWDTTKVTRSASSVTNSETCTQLRVDPTTKRLQWRTWVVGANGTSYSALTSWTTLASNVTNGTSQTGTTIPFSPGPSSGGASAGLQQLSVNLVTSSATATSASTGTSYVFTAVNSGGLGGTNTNVCNQVTVGATS